MAWHIAGEMVGDETTRQIKKGLTVPELFWKKSFSPKNHLCVKRHHKSSLYHGGSTARDVYIMSHESRSYRGSVIKLFCQQNHSCLESHYKCSLYSMYKPNLMTLGTAAADLQKTMFITRITHA